MDKDKVTALTLLDLSAAFDTIDHSILLDRLQKTFSIYGLTLNWISSYLSETGVNILNWMLNSMFTRQSNEIKSPIACTLMMRAHASLLQSRRQI